MKTARLFEKRSKNFFLFLLRRELVSMRMIGVAVMAMMATGTGVNAHADDRSNTLCQMFAGHEIGTKSGRPVLATCPVIQRFQARSNALATGSPFKSLEELVNASSFQTFEQFLAGRGSIYRQRCHQDYNFSTLRTDSYTCLTHGVPFRFFLDQEHHVTKLTMTIAADGESGNGIRAITRHDLSMQPDPIVDEPNQEFILLTWHIAAARYAERARPGESVRVEGNSMIVEVRNLSAGH